VVSFTPRPLYPQGKTPGTHWIGGWVGKKIFVVLNIPAQFFNLGYDQQFSLSQIANSAENLHRDLEKTK
jgi:hypothetical protein